MNDNTRCAWCGVEPYYVDYHDTEWGVPLHNERALFEFLILEGAQAGLSWSTILKKREGYRHGQRSSGELFPASRAGGDGWQGRLTSFSSWRWVSSTVSMRRWMGRGRGVRRPGLGDRQS